MNDRLVFTLAFGKPRFAEMAMGLARSLSLIGDDTPRAILTDVEGYDWERYFDVVVRRSVPREETFWAKLYGIDLFPGRRVLFLDGDSLAFRRLGPVFDAFAGAPFGVQAYAQTEGTWYGKSVPDLLREEGIPSLPKFNGGLLYYEPGDGARAVVAEAKRVAEQYHEIGFGLNATRHNRGVVADEPCLALALARTGLGRVVPDTANFHNSAVGWKGKLDVDVRRARCRYLCRRYDLQFVEPYVLHAHFLAGFLKYWRELAKLKRLERIEDAWPHGHMTRPHRWERSLNRRWIRLRYGVR